MNDTPSSAEQQTPYHRSNQFVRANGIDFHYALEGEADKPLLVLINMASHNLTCWEPVLPALLKQFCVLRFDLRGTGKSGCDDGDEITFEQNADDTIAIMDALSLADAFVAGVAYGARTATRIALKYPERLTGLALFDVSLLPPVEQSGQKKLALEAIQLLREAGEPEPQLKKYWRYYEDRDASLKAHSAHRGEPDLTPQLAQVKLPTLVACGRQDMNLDEARRVANALENSHFEIMEKTGHGSPFFRPILFAQLISKFYEDCIAPP